MDIKKECASIRNSIMMLNRDFTNASWKLLCRVSDLVSKIGIIEVPEGKLCIPLDYSNEIFTVTKIDTSDDGLLIIYTSDGSCFGALDLKDDLLIPTLRSVSIFISDNVK